MKLFNFSIEYAKELYCNIHITAIQYYDYFAEGYFLALFIIVIIANVLWCRRSTQTVIDMAILMQET